MPKEFEPRWLSTRMSLYLSYTSWATGTPKGIVHTHHDLIGILAMPDMFWIFMKIPSSGLRPGPPG
jgi:acyl-coenzyme A synthetase/AMP-(fatty) acid ligase